MLSQSPTALSPRPPDLLLLVSAIVHIATHMAIITIIMIKKNPTMSSFVSNNLSNENIFQPSQGFFKSLIVEKRMSSKQRSTKRRHCVVHEEPKAPGLPFAMSRRVGDVLYLSGQMGVLPGTMQVVEGGLQKEAEVTMENIKLIVESHGLGMGDVFKCTVMLADMSRWQDFNAVYLRYFDPSSLPTRSAFGVTALALGAQVEVEAVAYFPPPGTFSEAPTSVASIESLRNSFAANFTMAPEPSECFAPSDDEDGDPFEAANAAASHVPASSQVPSSSSSSSSSSSTLTSNSSSTVVSVDDTPLTIDVNWRAESTDWGADAREFP